MSNAFNTKRLCFSITSYVSNLLKNYEHSFSHRKFFCIMASLIVILVIDISIVKVYDIVNKSFIPIQDKVILFSINSSLCILLEFVIIKYIKNSLKSNQLYKRSNINLLYTISLTVLCIVGALLGVLIFQQMFANHYDILFSALVITVSYGAAVGFIGKLSTLFLSWYMSNHNLITFLYFISLSLIAFNLVITVIIADFKINDRPHEVEGSYSLGTEDLDAGKYAFLDSTYNISSVVSFVSIWITTALIMNNYREKLMNSIVYWSILCIPLIYFLVIYFYQYIFGNLLISYLAIDPITVSILMTTVLSLSKPIGGVTFAFVFWKISKTVGYEKNLKTYMIISGWGILLIFGADQALVQTLTPYPPFGLATITILSIAAFLMLVGIYNSAVLVSANNDLRKSIYKHALESKLLGQIGRAEMENELQKTVTKIADEKKHLMTDTQKQPVELDGMELKKYIEFVVREVNKDKKQ